MIFKMNEAYSHNSLENEIINVPISNAQSPRFISYTSVPSLKRIAIIRIATLVYMPVNIRNDTKQSGIPWIFIGRQSVQTNFLESKSLKKLKQSILSTLSLPTLLKDEVASIVRLLALQRSDWCYYLNSVLKTNIDKTYPVYWTNVGTIDEDKTLEKIINEESKEHMKSLYELACKKCSETCVSLAWNKLPKHIQKTELARDDIYQDYDTHLLSYWISIAKGELSELLNKIERYDNSYVYNYSRSIYTNMFTLAVTNGNMEAVQYFWKKLTDEEKYKNLSRWLNTALLEGRFFFQFDNYGLVTNGRADVLYFLLSQMTNSEQQREVFKNNSKYILHSLFLYWPWQTFLLPTLEEMWPYLEEKTYILFLNLVVCYIKEGHGVERLLREIWHASPISFKKSFIHHILDTPYGTNVFCNLLLVEDLDTIKDIVKHVNTEEKKQIMFSIIKNKMLLESLYTEKLTLLDTLMDYTLTSELDVKLLKELVVTLYVKNLCHQWIYDDNWKMVERFFDWTAMSQDQIDEFKNQEIDKMEVVYSIVSTTTDFAIVDKFLNWCYSSKEEINQFKKNFVFEKIAELGSFDFNIFETFVDWCFMSTKEIDEIKSIVSQHFIIVYNALEIQHNFEFVYKLINWFCRSQEEVKTYKENFVLSQKFMTILKEFVCNTDPIDPKYSSLELTEKIFQLFSPLPKRVNVMLKDKITKHIYSESETRPRPLIGKIHLFCLLDIANDFQMM